MINNNLPLVSVILSTFNNSQSINDSVNSILGQTYKNIEFLILDDGSTDNTWEKLNKFNDRRIKLFKNNNNIGLTKSLNKLISKSSGQYVARQDADDISLSHRLEVQINILSTSLYQVCTSRAKIKDNGSLIPGFSFNFPYKFIFRYKNPFIHGTMMIEKYCLDSINGYDENFYYAQDYKLFSDLIKSDISIYQIKEPLYILNMKNTISTEKLNEQNYFASCVRKNIIPDL